MNMADFAGTVVGNLKSMVTSVQSQRMQMISQRTGVASKFSFGQGKFGGFGQSGVKKPGIMGLGILPLEQMFGQKTVTSPTGGTTSPYDYGTGKMVLRSG